MADDVGVFVAGDRDLSLKFDKFPQQLHQRLKGAIVGLTEKLETMVEGAVPRASGKLAGEIKAAVYDSNEKITGRVSVSAEFAKAAALEYSAHHRTSVKAHQMKLGHLWARAASTPLFVQVPEHSRTPNIQERNFLRRPEAAIAGQVYAELTAVVQASD